MLDALTYAPNIAARLIEARYVNPGLRTSTYWSQWVSDERWGTDYLEGAAIIKGFWVANYVDDAAYLYQVCARGEGGMGPHAALMASAQTFHPPAARPVCGLCGAPPAGLLELPYQVCGSAAYRSARVLEPAGAWWVVAPS